MKEKNKIEDNGVKLNFDKKVYSTVAIKKALYNYTDKYFIKIEEENDYITAFINSKNDNNELEDSIKEIYNKVLEEDIKCTIEEETRNIRELLYKKAMNVVNDECE